MREASSGRGRNAENGRTTAIEPDILSALRPRRRAAFRRRRSSYPPACMTPSSHGADAPSATRASCSGLFWVIGGLGAAGVFLWCLLVIPGTRDAFPTGDGAVIELYTLQASRGWWEYGPYSRWGWHHPGPLVFYALAPFYTASHAQSLAIIAGAVAINLIALTAILWALARHASAALAVAVDRLAGAVSVADAAAARQRVESAPRAAATRGADRLGEHHRGGTAVAAARDDRDGARSSRRRTSACCRAPRSRPRARS